MLADFDPAVTAVAAQPFRLIGRDGSRVRRHVPDVLLAGADGGVTVVDVKAPGKRADPEVRAVMEWTRRVAALRGWAFEEWYGAPPRLLENVRFLAGYRRRGLIDEQLDSRGPGAAGEPSPVTGVKRSCQRRPSGLWSGWWSCTCCGPGDLLRTWEGRWAGTA